MIIAANTLKNMLVLFKHEFAEHIFQLEAASFHKIVATLISSNSRSSTYG